MSEVLTAAAQLVPLAAAAVTAAIPFVVPAMRRAFGWQINAAQAAIIDGAVRRGAAVAAQVVQAGALEDATSGALRNGAVASGVEYVVRRVPDALKALGLTPAHVEEMVSAELTRLIPATPALARMPVPAPAPAPVAAAAPAGRDGGAMLRALGTLAVLVLGAGALSACSAQRALSVVQKACVVDGQIVPLGDAALASVGGATGAAVAQVDLTAIHPAVVAACAALHGMPVLMTQPATAAGVPVSGTVLAVTPVPVSGTTPAQPAK